MHVGWGPVFSPLLIALSPLFFFTVISVPSPSLSLCQALRRMQSLQWLLPGVIKLITTFSRRGAMLKSCLSCLVSHSSPLGRRCDAVFPAAAGCLECICSHAALLLLPPCCPPAHGDPYHGKAPGRPFLESAGA